jgi:hypothetical protein
LGVAAAKSGMLNVLLSGSVLFYNRLTKWEDKLVAPRIRRVCELVSADTENT